jgi:UPF0716 protein FxsA
MIFRLACLFALVPLLELVILIQIGQAVGLWPTLGLVLATGLLGALLARREGTRVLRTIQAELTAGRLPTQALMDGAAVLVGAVLLLTPGIVTDLAGLGLLLPATRRLFSGWVRSRMARAMERGTLRVSIWGGPPYGVANAPGARGGPEQRKGEIIQE